MLKGSFLSSLLPAISLGGAVAGLAAYLKNATAAAAQSAQVDAKLEAVIRATGGAAGLTAGQIDVMSSSLSKMSGVDDEVVKNGAAVLLTFREIGEQVFPQAMEAALNMSAVMGQDLQSSIVQIGKALNDPIAGVTALRKVGVQLTDQQKEQIEAFIASGDVMSAQKVILDELGAEFGGAAEAMNKAGSGSENLKVSLGNLAEEIGSVLLPGQRSLTQALTEGVDALTANIAANNDFRETLKSVNPEMYKQYMWTQTITPEMMKVVTAAQKEANADRDLADSLARVSVESEAATTSQMDFKSQLDDLNTILGGDLMDAQQNYNEAITEYRQQLAEARKEKEKDEINANIAAETAAYNERAEAIAFNIQREAILNSTIPDGTKIEMITALGVAYGEFDQATANMIMNNQNLLGAVEAGNLTWQQAAEIMQTSTQGMMATGEAAMALTPPVQNLADIIYHTGERSRDASEDFGVMGSAAEALGENIMSSALPAAGGLKSELQGMPPPGTMWRYYFDISVSGKVPRLPSFGQIGATGLHEQVGTSGGGYWTGGQLGSDWTVVGDMPGGAWGPYTELVSPSGYVFDARMSRKIKESGLLGSVSSAYFGSEDIGGAVTVRGPRVTTKPKEKRGRNPRTIARAEEQGPVSVPEDPGDGLAAIGNQVAGDIEGTVSGAVAAAQHAANSSALLSQTILKDINHNLQTLISKTPSAADISRSVHSQASKFS